MTDNEKQFIDERVSKAIVSNTIAMTNFLNKLNKEIKNIAKAQIEMNAQMIENQNERREQIAKLEEKLDTHIALVTPMITEYNKRMNFFEESSKYGKWLVGFLIGAGVIYGFWMGLKNYIINLR